MSQFANWSGLSDVFPSIEIGGKHALLVGEISGKMMTENGDVAQVKHAAISASSSGNNTLVSAVTGKKIRVVSLHIRATEDVNIRFESGAGGDALSGVMLMEVLSSDLVGNENAFINLGFSPHGHFETNAGELLNLELSAAVQVSGLLSYIEV